MRYRRADAAGGTQGRVLAATEKTNTFVPATKPSVSEMLGFISFSPTALGEYAQRRWRWVLAALQQELTQGFGFNFTSADANTGET